MTAGDGVTIEAPDAQSAPAHTLIAMLIKNASEQAALSFAKRGEIQQAQEPLAQQALASEAIQASMNAVDAIAKALELGLSVLTSAACSPVSFTPVARAAQTNGKPPG